MRIFRALTLLSCLFLSGCGHHRAPADVATAGSGAAGDRRVSDEYFHGSPADISISESLRKAILADPSMSVNARNIFVYTHNGAVTLQGAVSSLSEQEQILSKLQTLPGIKSVVNRLQPLTANEVSGGVNTQ